MPTIIGTFEAKTKLSEILRKVEQGERFTITVRGRPVADLIPAQEDERRRQSAEAVKSLLNTPRIQGVTHEMIREWINEGRD